MYKVIVVDDEYDIRNRIISLMKQINLDFEVIADYENGIDAYEGISSNVPDLLITDIRIPYINGIELIEKVRRIAPLLKVIIITGYDQFDYAKSAIDLGVISFITKPITKNELEDVLVKVKDSLEKEYSLMSDLIDLKNFHEENYQLIKENDLCRLVSMSNLSINFLKKLEKDGINLYYNNIMLGIIDYDVDVDLINPEKFELVFLSIKSMILGKKNINKFFEVYTRNDKLIVIIKADETIYVNEIEKIFEKILFRVNRMNKYTLSIGFSKLSNKPHNFKKMFDEAKKALEFRSLIGGNQIFFYDNLSNSKVAKEIIGEEELKVLAYTINYQTLKEIDKYIDTLFSKLKEIAALAAYQHFFFNILNVLINNCDNLEALQDNYYPEVDLYQLLLDAKTDESKIVFFKNLVRNIKTINEDYKQKGMDYSFQAVVDYIESHYHDVDLNLEMLAEQVDLSVSYICALFKKNLNTTFVKYLTGMRMKKAIELLKNKSLKILDVAEAVGYNDAYYFSHCFKKHYGLSPKEYRTNG